MSQKDPDKASTTVCDVMAYFSEEDWKLLHDWQKELYKNVMNEIHHALVSLGPLIANSVSSMKDKRKDQSSLEQLESEGKFVIDTSPDGDAVIPRITLNIKEEEDTYSADHQNSDKGENINSPVGDEAIISRLSVSIKEEDDICSMDHQDTERQESMTSPKSYPDTQPRGPVVEMDHSHTETDDPDYGFSSHSDESEVIFVDRIDHFRGGDCGITSNSGFSTRSNEMEANCMDSVEHVDARRGECSRSPHSSDPVITSVLSQAYAHENTFFLKNPNSGEQNSGLLTSPGWELRKRQMRKGSDNRKNLQSLKSLNKSSEFTDHQVHEKHWQGAFKCGQCGKTFSHKLDIINHHRMHNIKKAYPGIEQGSRSNQWSTAFKPNGTHTGQRSITWTKYDKKIDGTQLQHQAQKRHTELKLCKCGQCGNSFYQSLNMTANQHANGAQQNTCGKCEKRTSLTRSLTQEQGPLLSDRPYVCSECGKTFKNSQTLITHRRIHTGEKPYPCGKCGKNFRQLSHLVTHQRIHTGEKPFVCNVCERRFHDSSNLKKHKEIHNRVFRFQKQKPEDTFSTT